MPEVRTEKKARLRTGVWGRASGLPREERRGLEKVALIEEYRTGRQLNNEVIKKLVLDKGTLDILATKEDHTIRIRVKTKTEDYAIWQWAVKKDGSTIFRNLSGKV